MHEQFRDSPEARKDLSGHVRSKIRPRVVRRGRVVGAAAVGPWTDFASVQQAISTRARVRPADVRRFEQGGALLRDTTVRLELWPDSATVCGCTGVTCGSLRRARAAGAVSASALSAQTGAGSVCGTCMPLLNAFTGEKTLGTPQLSTLAWFSGAALLLSMLALSVPPIPFAESVQHTPNWDVLWRDPTLKQVSGYSLLALGLASAALSLRKRLTAISWGNFPAWRTVHSAIGAATLAGFALHTGFRLGAHLDFALGLTFLLMSTGGAFAGLATVVERRLSAGRGVFLRRLGGHIHLWLTWPLPVLVIFHVLKVYFF